MRELRTELRDCETGVTEGGTLFLATTIRSFGLVDLEKEIGKEKEKAVCFPALLAACNAGTPKHRRRASPLGYTRLLAVLIANRYRPNRRTEVGWLTVPITCDQSTAVQDSIYPPRHHHYHPSPARKY